MKGMGGGEGLHKHEIIGTANTHISLSHTHTHTYIHTYRGCDKRGRGDFWREVPVAETAAFFFPFSFLYFNECMRA